MPRVNFQVVEKDRRKKTFDVTRDRETILTGVSYPTALAYVLDEIREEDVYTEWFDGLASGMTGRRLLKMRGRLPK